MKPEWRPDQEQPQITGTHAPGNILTLDEGSPWFSGTPDNRRTDGRIIRSRSDPGSTGRLITDWLITYRGGSIDRITSRDTLTIPPGAQSIAAIATIHIAPPSVTGDQLAAQSLELARQAVAAWKAKGVSDTQIQKQTAWVTDADKTAPAADKARVRAILSGQDNEALLAIDAAIHGFTATDITGKRIDPSTLTPADDA